MSREILFNGHFFYGHRLGRYFRPDDLAITMLKKREPAGSRFSFVAFACQPGRGWKKSVGAEHRFNAAYGLANAIAVFN